MNCDRCHYCLQHVRDTNGLLVTASKMILCEICGNKRCPHATDHRLTCTASNDPGQAGSMYSNMNFRTLDE